MPRIIQLQVGALLLYAILANSAAGAASSSANVWPQAHSDIKSDPSVRFGALANGMRYAILRNSTPTGQVALRLRIGAGSLQEQDSQQGLAHFLEHMAFRGSTHVPDGEVFKSLERLGLKTGADSNAFTAYTQTAFMFDLPRSDDATLDAGLRQLRETADQLLLQPSSFNAERGVVLSEVRLNENPTVRMAQEQQAFVLQGQLAARRFPIGKGEIVEKAPVARVQDFYRAYYRPERATLIVVGDVNPEALERKIKAQFSSWKNEHPAGADPDLGMPSQRDASTKVFAQAGAPNFISLAWVMPYDAAPDTVARERRDFIELIGLEILNHRLQAAAAATNRPFSRAAISRSNVERSARITSLVIQPAGERWQAALSGADQLRRQILQQGVQQSEVDREISQMRAQYQAAAAGAATEPSARLANSLLQTVDTNDVYTSAAQDLAFVEATLKDLKADTVDEALRAAFQGSGPLAFVSGQNAIAGGETEVSAALTAAESAPIETAVAVQQTDWPYMNFGAPGQVAERRRLDDLDMTLVRFANGVRLNIKPTKFKTDQILINVHIGSGKLGLPKDRGTLDWAASGALILGGLGKVDFQTMQRQLAAKIYRISFQVGDASFILSGQTRPADLDTQLQVLTAYLSDAAFRPEAFEQPRSNMLTMLNQNAAIPMALFQTHLSGLLHDGDKRWVLPSIEEVRAARTEDLKASLTSALAGGAIEIAIIGDTSVDQGIAAVAATFGALPPRASDRLHARNGDVQFPAPTATPVVLPHHGGVDQGVAAIAWPTTDAFSDPKGVGVRQLMTDIIRQRLMDELRLRDSTSYSPQALALSSTVFPGYGGILGFADIPPAKATLFFDAIAKIANDLRSTPVTVDEIERARNPAVSKLRQAQQTNEYWLGTLGEVQSEPRLADLVRQSLTNLQSVTAADIQGAANSYLLDDKAWKLSVEPAAAP